MASRYWVGGTGNWSDTAHWSASSGGSGGASYPLSSDDANFDSNSGTAATITVDITLGANTILLNKSDASLIFNAVTTVVGVITVTAGTFNTNNQTCSWGGFSSSNTNTRSISFGSSSITVTGFNSWTMSTTTNLTFDAGTSTITFTSATTSTLNFGPKTYYDLVFNGGSGSFTTGGAFTAHKVTYTGSASKTGLWSVSAPFTVDSEFIANGNSATNRIFITTNTTGDTRTITCNGTVTCSNVDFREIVGAGSASWDLSAITGGSGDYGLNSGITFTTAETQYFGGVRLNGSYLHYKGAANNYVSAPDSSALSVTGDLTIDVKVALDDWTPSVEQTLVSKWNTGQRSYLFFINTSGIPCFSYSTDGTTGITKTTGAATGFTDGDTWWLRVKQDVDNGASGNDVDFYYSSDGSSWTQIGSTSTTAGAITRRDSTALLEIGSTVGGGTYMLKGKMYRAIIYSDLTPSAKVFDADFTAQANGTKSFTESSSYGATVSLINSSGTWSDVNKWTTRVPLPQDPVFINNAFAYNAGINADMPRLGKDIDWTGSTGTPKWQMYINCGSRGSLTLISGMVKEGWVLYYLYGTGNHTITTAGIVIGNTGAGAWGITINNVGGTYSLQDVLNMNGKTLNINGGLVSNGYTINTAIFASNSSSTRTINLEGSIIYNDLNNASATVFSFTSTGLTLSAATATVIFSAVSAYDRAVAMAGKELGSIIYIVAGSTGKMRIIDTATFGTVHFTDTSNARTLEMPTSKTVTITDSFKVYGTDGKLMTINTGTAGTAATLTKAGGVVSCDYVSIKDSVATGGAGWYAGGNSTDVSGNSGWIFGVPPNRKTLVGAG